MITEKIENDDLTKRLIEIFRKVEPTKEEMLLSLGIAYMAGMEKGKRVN
ncbi:hypothetical protein CLL_A2286 [Clostridium botulinum B str. Eklund 17B (NRP)]|uniref:Uncharacterized protein n=1 Tax=Clostridium botulinum (strain Eklund 17B / Type B) TaxID=935198 RepID=B2TRZ4_CLOBB|nr:hypothetical protein CLL_A2286 [Clostridium botulinum B str. Eklund 17B (NRP)]MBY6975807.1 hypothetical protein [Clostridium botulinum]MBY7000230.1 hypothetical protein [Clostridium botulinum]MCR1272988.1 hypothetical protein [Clostridium botulinum]CDH91191.1 conserved hypothetical protein [Clostridium botulinum B str. Eklund 17B (NRP)]